MCVTSTTGQPSRRCTAATTGAVVIWAAIALPETRKLNAAPGARQSFVADLSDLAREGLAQLTLRYGSTGRPEHCFEWLGRRG